MVCDIRDYGKSGSYVKCIFYIFFRGTGYDYLIKLAYRRSTGTVGSPLVLESMVKGMANSMVEVLARLDGVNPEGIDMLLQGLEKRGIKVKYGKVGAIVQDGERQIRPYTVKFAELQITSLRSFLEALAAEAPWAVEEVLE